MPDKVYKSSHWIIRCKTAKLNNTDILDEWDLDQAKKQLLDELNILLEDSVYPEFGRVVVRDMWIKKPGKPLPGAENFESELHKILPKGFTISDEDLERIIDD